MAHLSDETLMAFADGELAPAERARVEAALAKDAESRAHLEIFVVTGRSLAPQFRKPLIGPVPQPLVDLVLAGGDRTTHSLLSRRSLVSATLSQLSGASALFLFKSLSYSAAVLIGCIFGWYSRDFGPSTPHRSTFFVATEDGRILARGALQRALETAPSGIQVSATEENDSVAFARTRLTFMSRQGMFCRQYELALRDGHQFVGIGCRDEDSSWQVQFHRPIASARSEGAATKPAGDNRTGGLTAIIEQIIDGDALGHGEEVTAIAKQWQPDRARFLPR
jgi:hypothetical protein